MMDWRPMQVRDLVRIDQIGDMVHPAHLYETREALASRFQIGGPHFCHTLFEERNVFGYLLAHPWESGSIPKLNTILKPPSQLSGLFIHDLAILERYRGRGFGSKVIDLLFQQAQVFNLPDIALVAVNGTRPFWESFGFEQQAADDGSLDTYGPDAVYMSRFIS